MPDLQKGLIGHWTMNSEDTDNGKIRDRSAYDNHGTLQNGPTTGVPSPVGGSYSFDGSDDYVGNFPAFIDSNGKSLSSAAWVKPSSNDYFVGDGGVYRISISGGDGVYFWVRGDNSSGTDTTDAVSVGSVLSFDQWHHIVGVWDGTVPVQKIYVDGNLVKETSTSVVQFNGGPGNFAIGDGYEGQSNYFDGNISDVRVYNRALSQSEINQLYNFRGNSRSSQKSSVAYDDLILWYPLSEAGATDKSDQNEDGTVNGGTYLSDGGPEGFGAYDFGDSDYIQVGSSSNLDNMRGGFTWSIWFKGDDQTNSGSDYPRLIDFGDTTLRVDGSKGSFRVWFRTGASSGSSDRTGGITASDATLGNPDKVWHHAVVVYDEDTTYLYIDGQLDGQNNTDGELLDIGDPLGIGSNDSGGAGFIGKISDVRVYSRALSESEAKELYDPKSVNLDRGLVGHWSMDDSDVSGGTLYDRSAYDNHGNIIGSTISSDSLVGTTSIDHSSSNSDRIEFPDGTIPSGTDPRTTSAWFKVSNDGRRQMIFGVADGSKGSAWEMEVDDPYNGGSDTIGIHTWSSWTRGENGILNGKFNQWNHFVAVWGGEDASNIKLYLNGEEVNIGSRDTNSGNISTATNTTASGSSPAHGNSQHWVNGKVDDIRVFNRALTEKEVNALYNKRTTSSQDSGFTKEGFEDGSISALEDENWTVGNATISSSQSYEGTYSFGSWGDGSVDARWNVFPHGSRQISKFSYYWIEDSSQTGHEVRLYDSNGDLVQRSETENPQWQLNDGTGGIETINSSSGTNYNVWTFFKFEFDWAAGNYDYRLEKTDGSHTETGTQPLDRSTNVSYIDFVGTNGRYCRFDEVKVTY